LLVLLPQSHFFSYILSPHFSITCFFLNIFWGKGGHGERLSPFPQRKGQRRKYRKSPSEYGKVQQAIFPRLEQDKKEVLWPGGLMEEVAGGSAGGMEQQDAGRGVGDAPQLAGPPGLRSPPLCFPVQVPPGNRLCCTSFFPCFFPARSQLNIVHVDGRSAVILSYIETHRACTHKHTHTHTRHHARTHTCTVHDCGHGDGVCKTMMLALLVSYLKGCYQMHPGARTTDDDARDGAVVEEVVHGVAGCAERAGCQRSFR
jgi:hypothetical protein